MSQMKLTKTRLFEGAWEGRLIDEGGAAEGVPILNATYEGQPVPGVEITGAEEPGSWTVRVPVPRAAISDGVNLVLIQDKDGETLARFAVLAGEEIEDDLRAEVALLRDELDLLKRAFRRHCLESG